MILKRILILSAFIMLAMSLLQVFPIPPYSNTLYPVFKSEYFRELDIRAGIVKQSFLGVKMYGRADAAWVQLKDIDKAYGLKSTIYNRKGRKMIAPSLYSNEKPSFILEYLKPDSSKVKGTFHKGKYVSIIPMMAQEKCRICHTVKKGAFLGLLTVEQPYNPLIIYSFERIIIFSFISLIVCAFIVLLWRWDPEKNVKELFDK